MNVTCVRAGTGYVVLNAQHDIVGILKSFEDSWKVEKSKALKMANTEVERAIKEYAKRKGGDPI